jgi:hypothetical protein
LKWTDAGDETGFQIQMVKNPNLKSTSAKSYTWTGLQANHRYCFAVRAVKTGAPSSHWSRQVCATTPAKVTAQRLLKIHDMLLALEGDWSTYCKLTSASGCKPWATGKLGKIMGWVDIYAKFVPVAYLGVSLVDLNRYANDVSALGKVCLTRKANICPLNNYKSWPKAAKQTYLRLYNDVVTARQSIINFIDSCIPVPFISVAPLIPQFGPPPKT